MAADYFPTYEPKPVFDCRPFNGNLFIFCNRQFGDLLARALHQNGGDNDQLLALQERLSVQAGSSTRRKSNHSDLVSFDVRPIFHKYLCVGINTDIGKRLARALEERRLGNHLFEPPLFTLLNKLSDQLFEIRKSSDEESSFDIRPFYGRLFMVARPTFAQILGKLLAKRHVMQNPLESHVDLLTASLINPKKAARMALPDEDESPPFATNVVFENYLCVGMLPDMAKRIQWVIEDAHENKDELDDDLLFLRDRLEEQLYQLRQFRQQRQEKDQERYNEDT
jgi:hypothetical protein